MEAQALRVASLSDQGPEWGWFDRSRAGDVAIDVRFFSAQASSLRRLPGFNWDRLRAALQLKQAIAREGFDVVASHGPHNAYYAQRIAIGGKPIPHFAAGFNFTDIPTGFRLRSMCKAFQHIDRFAVFTELERHLYARTFRLPIERFHFVRWGVAPPIAEPLPRSIAEPYAVAIGGEARDYRTLADAARRLPGQRFVVVARPNSFDGIDVPANVTVLTNRPWHETWSLAAHADFALVPLRSSETPNGIVTIVGAMHLGKAQIVTDSLGVHDYLENDVTGLLVPAGDSAAFARAVERLRDEPATAARLGAAARDFAATRCNEDVVADFTIAQLRALAGRSNRA
jgi:glycosyltransferase involved in cell wall biosynthesis